MRRRLTFLTCLVSALATFAASGLAFRQTARPAARLKVLFLGDNGHHKPATRASELLAPLAKVGIDLAYTDDLRDLNTEYLSRFDALMIYANHERIAPEQEQALLDYVDGGKGLVVLHCGSYCFLNSPKYVALVGGQFKSHETGRFQTIIDKPDHPALSGVEAFEAFDETYVHAKLTDDRDVLMHRDDKGRAEPWTWTRAQGKGRVFYTASGHDENVFTHPGFHKLVIAGTRWAANRPAAAPIAPLSYRDSGADIPNYVRSDKWGTQGEAFRKMQEPLSPADSMTHMSVPGGFRVELFAAEPDVIKPICMTWDARGRLFVAETVDYPNNKQRAGEGHDRIKICEDTDGDGKADKFTVFADKLSIPTSMVAVPGGLIVSQAPEMLYLADTDGDDKADVKKALFTGFGIDDTHAGPSNLRLGFDGWIYGTCGYSGFRGRVGDRAVRFGQALFRFRPDGSALEVLTSTSNNTWGLGLTEDNEVVYSTANGEHSSYLGMPNRGFESVRGWLGRGNAKMADHDRMRPTAETIRQVDWFGGFTAAAGHAVYTARQFPKEYWNRAAFVCEPTGHVVHMCMMERDGSHLKSRDRFNLFSSTDEWTSPVVAEVGPDGAVWISDWYNYIVQHNPTPLGFKTGRGNAYETPLRDKAHGRIYRIVNVTAPLGKPFSLDKKTPSELVEVLKHDNMFWRMQAQWALVAAQDDKVGSDLWSLAVSKQAAPAPAVHALWALKGLGLIPDDKGAYEALRESLRHAAPEVRRAAVDILPRSVAGVDAILDANLLADPDPAVRRAALMALGESPPNEKAAQAIVTMLAMRENASDRWIPVAATTAAARNAEGFLPLYLAVKEPSAGLNRVASTVAEHYARLADGKALDTIVNALATADAGAAATVLAAFAKGWPDDKKPTLDAAAQNQVVALMARLDTETQPQLALLAQRWGFGEKVAAAIGELRTKLAEEFSAADRSDAQRVASARRLLQLSADRETIESLLGNMTARTSPALSSGLLDALGQTSGADVAPALIERWNQVTPALRKQVIEILMRRPEWTRSLVDAIEADTIASNDLAIDQSQRLAEHPDKTLAERAKAVFARGGRLPSPDREKVITELLPLTKQSGDAALGKLVFEKNCSKCHRHGEMGENIGPNLTGFAVHPKDKILAEVIDPNRSVEGNFRQYTVATNDGQVIGGLLASETRTAIELVDNEAKRHVILRENIDEMIASPKSLMPEGFEKQIAPEEFVNLLEFLAAKGKYVPLPIDKATSIVSTRGMFYDKASEAERLIFADWSPKTIEGVPFVLIDPRGDRVPNIILMHSPNGPITSQMPKKVEVPCGLSAKALHFLSGVSGWGFPYGPAGTTSLVVRLHYADGQTEDHELKNGEHFADYIRRVDVPGSKFAQMLRAQQIRTFAIEPKRDAVIAKIELIKGDDTTAPVVMAITAEGR